MRWHVHGSDLLACEKTINCSSSMTVKTENYLLATFLLTVAACENLETVENHYSNTESAINSGAIERGWVPVFLPPSAKDIYEQHNLDTNEVWLSFAMDADDLDMINRSCQKTGSENVSFPRMGIDGGWWPETLTERGIDSHLQQAAEYTHYRCENGGSIAVEDGGRKVFYWHFG